MGKLASEVTGSVFAGGTIVVDDVVDEADVVEEDRTGMGLSFA